MRALLAAVAAALLVAPAAHAHSGFVDIKQYAFTPPSFTVSEGVLVVWRWDGPDLNHTVTGDFFESDPGKQPAGVLHQADDTFPVYFDKAGTYAYHCRVHPEMTGTIVVEPPSVTDRTPPELNHVRVRPREDRVAVEFRIDEAASVTAELRRRGEVVRDAFRFVKPGARRTSLSLKGVRRDGLTVRVRAQDDAGNFSRPRTVPVTA